MLRSCYFPGMRPLPAMVSAAIDTAELKTSLRPEFYVMKAISVGVYEAKTKLPRLLARVARGGEVIITKHDKPVARLTSIPGEASMPLQEALEGLAQIRARVRRGPESLRDLISAGRRL